MDNKTLNDENTTSNGYDDVDLKKSFDDEFADIFDTPSEPSYTHNRYDIEDEEDTAPQAPEIEEDTAPQAPEIDEDIYKRVQERKNEIKKNREPQKTQRSSTRKVKVKYIKPKKGNRIAFSLIFTSIIVGISVIASITIIFLAKEFFGIDKSASSYLITVPKGADVNQVMELMTSDQEKRGKEPIIRVKPLFELLVKIKERGGNTLEFVPGEHKLSPNMGYSDILSELISVDYIERTTVRLTFTEGKTLNEIAQLLEKEGVCPADTFIYYFNNGLSDYDFIDKIPKATANSLRYHRMEGYLFPDTYEFYKAIDMETMEDADYEIILRKIYDNFEEKYTEEFEARAEELGMTMDDIVILASMIQKEAKDNADMYYVSSVFHNRINDPDDFGGFESNPTSNYADWLREQPGTTESMARAYDTYDTQGLPPGAICNPGLEALTAALYPADTNYYFFCAGNGQVFYAETYEEHKQNEIAAGIRSE